MRRQEKRFRIFRKVRNVATPVLGSVFVAGTLYSVVKEQTNGG